MCQRSTYALTKLSSHLRDEKGQALAELPVVIVLVCITALLLLQPLVHLYTKTMLGQVAAELSRVVATEAQTPTGGRETLLKAYAADKLEGLPKGSAFFLPGSLKVTVSGSAGSERIDVRVSVRQKPLPLMGFLAGAGGQDSVEVSGKARTRGAWCGTSGTPQSAPQVYGMLD